jgi:uncharacterized linocin/CFP29 family protein
MTDILKRKLAPVTDEAWKAIDEEAVRAMKPFLTARKLVDFDGPHGLDKAAVNLGRLDYDEKNKVGGVNWATRKVLPLVEIRVPVKLKQFELDNISRGCEDPDLGPLEDAARKAAGFEENVVFNGFAKSGIEGIIPASAHKAVEVGADATKLPEALGKAVETLQMAGVGGPYALVLDAERYYALMQNTKPGYPLYKVVESLLGGSIHWSPAVKTGVVLSARGGDFRLTVGQDLAVGYFDRTRDEVEFFITESFTFQVLCPAAAVPLK